MVALQMDSTIPQRALDWLNEYAAKYRISIVFISNQKINNQKNKIYSIRKNLYKLALNSF
jgi:hypothetical protein